MDIDRKEKFYHINRNTFNGINKKEINFLIGKLSGGGKNYLNTTEQRDIKLIASLTSFPERISEVHYVIYSLLQQTTKPDKLILWLGKEKFPKKYDELPGELLHLQQFGLVIRFTEELGPYTKLIPALKEFPDSIVITFDDDIFYHENCIKLLYGSYIEAPRYIHCHRAHRLTFDEEGNIRPYYEWDRCVKGPSTSYLNWITACSGALYPPHILSETVFEQNLFRKLAPTADDTWFWAMALVNDVKIKVVNDNIDTIVSINLETAMGRNGRFRLCEINVFQRSDVNPSQNKNEEQLNKVIEHFNLKSKLITASEERPRPKPARTCNCLVL